MKNCNNLRNCSSQSEKSEQPMREQKYSHWRKQLTDIQGESSELKTLEWWISGLMLDPLILISSRLT